jgi:hypothetical protein
MPKITNIEIHLTTDDPSLDGVPQCRDINLNEFFMVDVQKAVDCGEDPFERMVEIMNTGSKKEAIMRMLGELNEEDM